MRLRIIAATVALAGCTTTPSDLRQKPAVTQIKSTKAPAEIAQCLAEEVSSLGAPSVRTTPTETVVSFHQMAATTLLFTISPEGLVEVRRVHGMIPYQDVLARCT